MGLGKVKRAEGGIKVVMWEANYKGGGPILMGEADLCRHYVPCTRDNYDTY